jgi:tetratricopeptide (TPR) repeat protein
VGLDREDTLKKAEKLLRQGRLDAAIAEYVRVVEDQPKDWNTANTLGDIYMRAGQTPLAVAQFSRIAAHFMEEGFYPRAAAQYKKILKISPDDESAQLNLAEIAARQGLLADAKVYFSGVEARRRARGDRLGADEIVLRLGDLDPADVEARVAAARVLAHSGEAAVAAARFRQLHDDLLDKGRKDEALAALRDAVRFNPEDREGRALLAREALAGGDREALRTYLNRDTAGDDPALMLAYAELELQVGRLESARDVLPKLLARDRHVRHRVMELAWSLTASRPEAALACIEAIVDSDVAAAELVDAASALEEFVARVPNQINALLRLVEICVDGGLEATMFEAQAQLADAYLSKGHAAEAGVIAEDLVAREPWDTTHMDRFRKALVMQKVADPDAVIAERLSGQVPFMATDPFTENILAGEPVEQPAAAPASRVEPAPAPSTGENRPPAAGEVLAAAAPAAQSASRSPAAGPNPQQRPAATQQKPAIQKPGAHKPAAPKTVAQKPGVQNAGQRRPQKPAPPPASQPSASTPIDLERALADLSKDFAPAARPAPQGEDLEQVFQDFRDEVTRKTGTDDAAQHMTLAATYLEMGMEDDAIQSLKRAARSPRHRFEAGMQLARLFKKRHDLPQAVEWMEHAAEAPAPSADAGLALLYDLGLTLEGMGETARALAVFIELQADAGEYRDVAERVERLSRVQAGG